MQKGLIIETLSAIIFLVGRGSDVALHINDFEIFKNIPTLYTKRLLLRKIEKGDLQDVFEYSSDSEVTKYLLWDYHRTLSDTKQYLALVKKRYSAGQFFDWALTLDGKMIGTCGFSKIDVLNDTAEVGYVLSRQYWGRGIAPEALRAVLAFGFERLKLNRIEADFMTENTRSLAVMKKCGMTFEGIRRAAVRKGAFMKDVGVCSILADEFYRDKYK